MIKKIVPLMMILAALTFILNQSRYTSIEITGDHPTLKIKAEKAITPKQKEKGLMFRKSLADGNGMIFIYQEPIIAHFWMKNMSISLDMLFINESGEITALFEKVPPCKTNNDLCPTYTYPEKIKYVLEVPSGTIKKHKINQNSLVKID